MWWATGRMPANHEHDSEQDKQPNSRVYCFLFARPPHSSPFPLACCLRSFAMAKLG